MMVSLSFLTPGILGAHAAVSTSSSVNILSKFSGLNVFEGCTNKCYPPDVQVAAGLNHIGEMVNLALRVFLKDGTIVQTKMLSSLFSVGNDSISDPKLLYDAPSQRWFASLADITTNSVRMAVSAGNDPTVGGWKTWAFPTTGTSCPDQPLLGVSDDKIVVSANDFSASCQAPFRGSQFWVVNKSDLVNGISSPGNYTSMADPTTASVYPVQSLSPTSTQYMISSGATPGSLANQTFSTSVKLYTVTGTPGINAVTVSTQRIPLTSGITAPPWATEKGVVGGLLNTGDARVLDAKWFAGRLWFGLNNSCLPAGDSTKRSCVRLVQIDTESSVMTRNFDVSAKGLDYFYPALGIDSFGNVPVIFGFSSFNDFPSLAATGHIETDSPDSWATPQTIVNGSILASNARYGDYFGAGIDPSDPTVAWVAGEYHDASIGTNCSFLTCWSTYLANIKVSPVLSTSFTYSRQSTDILSPVTFTPSASGGSSPYFFSWDFGDGINALGNPVTHNFRKTGAFMVVLTTSDSVGHQAMSTQSLLVTITSNEEFTLDWLDYGNDGTIAIDDAASISVYYNKVCSTLSEPDRSMCGYWDYSLAGAINIVDIAQLAIWYSYQTDTGAGRPAYAMDLKWRGCAMLSGDAYNYCVARSL